METEGQSESSVLTSLLPEESTYYRVNYERFTFEFLKEACVQLAVQRYDERAGQLLREVFNLLQSKLLHHSAMSEWAITETQLLNQVNTWPEGQRLRLDQIHNYIDLWTKGNYPFLTRLLNPPESFLLSICASPRLLPFLLSHIHTFSVHLLVRSE
jgi:hypothetical protein